MHTTKPVSQEKKTVSRRSHPATSRRSPVPAMKGSHSPSRGKKVSGSGRISAATKKMMDRKKKAKYWDQLSEKS